MAGRFLKSGKRLNVETFKIIKNSWRENKGHQLLPILANLVLVVWISDETLPLVFDILPLGVLISWNSFLVFNILLLAFWIYAFQVLRYQMKHSFSCLMYYFSVFGYQMEHSFSCFIYYFSVFGNQMKHLSIQLGTMYSFRLFMQRKQKIQLWITPSHLSKYKDSIPLADRNRNNLVVLARMNNYLYRGWCQIVKFSNCNLFPQRT